MIKMENIDINQKYDDFKARIQEMIDNKLENACIDYIENNGESDDAAY